MRRLAVIVCLLLALGLYEQGMAGAKAEKNLKSLFDEILTDLQEFQPVKATEMGIHTYDSRFTDYSPRSIDQQVRQLRKFLARLYKYQPIKLPLDMEIDRRLARDNCEILTLWLGEVRYHTKNPNLYLQDASGGLYYLLIRDYVPLRQRLDDIIGRMNALPELLAQGEANLKDPPPVWLDYARKNVVDVIDMYRSVAAELSAQFPDRAGDIEPAAATAAAALVRFQQFLKELTPGPEGSFAIGDEYFNYLLKHDHLLDFDADSLLAIGLAAVDRYRAAYLAEKQRLAAARKMAAEDVFVPAGLGKKDLLDYYAWEIEAVKNFFLDRDLLTYPETLGKCLAMETPPFMQTMYSTVGYEPPGPFDSAPTGYFYAGVIPDSLSAGQKMDFFKTIAGRKFRSSVVHEAWPGHHLQLQIAAGAGSEVRRWQRNDPLVEGWAFYCEILADEMGLYADAPLEHLDFLKWLLIRAVRVVLDVQMQTGTMTFRQAVDYMMETVELDSASLPFVEDEVLRYTMNPGRPMSYLIGMQAIEKLRDTIKSREGEAFDLKSFHDRLLAEGSIPPALIEMKLLK